MPADSVRIYDGTTQKKSGSNLRINSIPRPNNSPHFRRSRNGGDFGQRQRGAGVLRRARRLLHYSERRRRSSNADSIHADTTQYYFRASSLKGNASGATPSQVGDPRTNDEQLATTTSTADDDQTAYKLEAWNSPAQIPNTTFTKLNANYVNPGLWNDFATNTAEAAHAPVVIANGALVSIGQLGDIFEPVRSIGVSGTIDYSRGGGRTFKIGQPDDLWDKNSTSPSREWTAWRLLDYFTTTDSLQLEGRINVNSVNRDGGSALKATLYGYNFEASPDSDPTIASQALTDLQIESLIAQIQSRLKKRASIFLHRRPIVRAWRTFGDAPVQYGNLAHWTRHGLGLRSWTGRDFSTTGRTDYDPGQYLYCLRGRAIADSACDGIDCPGARRGDRPVQSDLPDRSRLERGNATRPVRSQENDQISEAR